MEKETTKRKCSSSSILRFSTALLVIVLLFGISTGTVFAYYTSTNSIENRLLTKGSGVLLQELFNPGTKWLPGETKSKVVWFANSEDVPQVLRFKMDGAWFDKNGESFATDYMPRINWTAAIGGADGDPGVVDAGQTWTKIGEYYYYNRVLLPKTSSGPTNTGEVMTGVTFGTELSNDGGHAVDFSGKRFSLTVIMEAVDVDAAVTAAAWGRSFVKSGDTISWL